jgi:hypothetical protein
MKGGRVRGGGVVGVEWVEGPSHRGRNRGADSEGENQWGPSRRGRCCGGGVEGGGVGGGESVRGPSRRGRCGDVNALAG